MTSAAPAGLLSTTAGDHRFEVQLEELVAAALQNKRRLPSDRQVRSRHQFVLWLGGVNRLIQWGTAFLLCPQKFDWMYRIRQARRNFEAGTTRRGDMPWSDERTKQVEDRFHEADLGHLIGYGRGKLWGMPVRQQAQQASEEESAEEEEAVQHEQPAAADQVRCHRGYAFNPPRRLACINLQPTAHSDHICCPPLTGPRRLTRPCPPPVPAARAARSASPPPHASDDEAEATTSTGTSSEGGSAEGGDGSGDWVPAQGASGSSPPPQRSSARQRKHCNYDERSDSE